MVYGFEIYDVHGHLTFSTSSITWLQLDRFTLAANQTVTNTYTGFNGWTLIAQIQLIDQPPDAQEHYSPVASMSNNVVTVGPQSGLSSFAANVIILAQE